MVLLRHLAAKLFEFNRTTTKYFGQIRRLFPQKAKVYRERYFPIAKRLRDYRWLDQLRNKMAFHFDDDDYLKRLQEISDTQELSMMAGEKQGETAFLFAEEIVSMPYFHKVGAGDIRRGLEMTAEFANKATSEVLEFYSSVQIDAANQYGLLSKQRHYEIDPKAVGIYGRDFIPIFASQDLRLMTKDIDGNFIGE